ncbi:uncharacterized protein TRAVEDRAFT_34025 [Trametes versicolor FP-101664 SS1]|uniref:uncharacterized protein n=1 Tax=Trametes versicolor (strain FP-101664) TaxID=717944 RepID=UPI000462246D|nr:uncharacterized protein TRAVEDRAFT_34025 [Trametes versicolor FP-101664 SS1]EIW62637.1 hypothetical protein TRAVEDRAFT_34025 [Trametes versicolor FP-101664 SS1]
MSEVTVPPTRLLPLGPEKLSEAECWWRDHQEWLAERGYLLRHRYRPDWKPSWLAKKEPFLMEYEDWYRPQQPFLLDAVCVADDSLVMLKQVKKSLYPEEVALHQYLLSEPLLSDPRNHTVPLLEVLDVPDNEDAVLLVMPMFRACNNPAWTTVGEVVAFLAQIFEVTSLSFTLARDCQAPNILYDPRPLYPNMFHPRVTDKSRDWKGTAKHSTRTLHPVKYYFIDFGLSRRYDPKDGPPREHPILGGDKSVPEFQNWNGELLDPFPTDIYYLGNLIRIKIMKFYHGIEFLEPLVQDMVQDDPTKRPTIQDVIRQFDELVPVKPLGSQKLRSRLIYRKEGAGDALVQRIAHAFRTARYILTRKPAIPRPL